MEIPITGLVRHVALPPAVQQALASDNRYNTALADSPYVAEPAWMILWKKLPAVAERLALVQRKLTHDQRVLVLTSEKRITIVVAMLRYNHLTLSELELLRPEHMSRGLSKEIFENYRDNVKVMKRFGPLLDAPYRLQWIAYSSPAEISDAKVLAHLATLTQWWAASVAYGQRSKALKTLFTLRPNLVARLAPKAQVVDESIVTTMAGSMHLTNPKHQATIAKYAQTYALWALGANPRTTPENLELVKKHGDEQVRRNIARRLLNGKLTVYGDFSEIKEQPTLQWLVKRACPYDGQEYRNSGHVDEMLALAANPNIFYEEARLLLRGLQSCYYVDSPLLPTIEAAMKTLIDLHPAYRGAYQWLYKDDTGTLGQDERYGSTGKGPKVFTNAREQSLTTLMTYFSYNSDGGELSELLTKELGDDPATWLRFLDIAKTAPSSAKLGLLIEVTHQIR
jgi:hypothetical protein